MPSLNPGMTRATPNVAGLPLATELSNILPSVVQPVYSTVTRSSLVGCSLLVDGVRTLVARPDAVFVASAGGAATSGGAGIGFCARAAVAVASERISVRRIRIR